MTHEFLAGTKGFRYHVGCRLWLPFMPSRRPRKVAATGSLLVGSENGIVGQVSYRSRCQNSSIVCIEEGETSGNENAPQL